MGLKSLKNLGIITTLMASMYLMGCKDNPVDSGPDPEPTKVTLRGDYVDKRGNPIVGADVDLAGMIVQTNANGAYSFSVDPGFQGTAKFTKPNTSDISDLVKAGNSNKTTGNIGPHAGVNISKSTTQDETFSDNNLQSYFTNDENTTIVARNNLFSITNNTLSLTTTNPGVYRTWLIGSDSDPSLKDSLQYTVTISAVQQEPNLNIPDQVGNEDEIIQVDLKQYASDKQDDIGQLVFNFIDGANVRKWVYDSNLQVVQFRAWDNWNGTESINVSVTDTDGNVVSQDVNITYLPVNDPPKLLCNYDTQQMLEDSIFNLALSCFHDYDGGDIFMYEANSIDNALINFEDDKMVVKPDTNWYGTLGPISVSASDAEYTTTMPDFYIDVLPVNDRPTMCELPDLEIPVGETYTSPSLDDCWDDLETSDENMQVRWSGDVQPFNLVLNSDRSITYSSSVDFPVQTRIILTIGDGQGGFAQTNYLVKFTNN